MTKCTFDMDLECLVRIIKEMLKINPDVRILIKSVEIILPNVRIMYEMTTNE